MIPRIIHQIWSSKYTPMPETFLNIGKAWKDLHPDWQYILWDDTMMEELMQSKYSQYLDIYRNLKYDVQRWDIIRYLILYYMGGLYVDCDCVCIEPVDKLLEHKNCCFSYEPKEHAIQFDQPYIISNAFIAFTPKHPFIQTILQQIIKELQAQNTDDVKWKYVLNTTGPYMLRRAYEIYSNKKEVFLLPFEFVSPLTKCEVTDYLHGKIDDEMLEIKLQKAVVVHLYMNSWV